MLRTRALIRTLFAVALLTLAVAGITGSADAKKLSCKAKKEQKGCKLKAPAGYLGLPANGSISLTVLKGSKKFFVQFRATPQGIRDTTCNPRNNRASTVINKPARVGKSYTLKFTSYTPFSVNTFSGKVKIKSAKKASFKGKYASYGKDSSTVPPKPSSTVLCQRSATVTAKRSQ